jgi:hypothetical protein
LVPTPVNRYALELAWITLAVAIVLLIIGRGRD